MDTGNSAVHASCKVQHKYGVPTSYPRSTAETVQFCGCIEDGRYCRQVEVECLETFYGYSGVLHISAESTLGPVRPCHTKVSMAGGICVSE